MHESEVAVLRSRSHMLLPCLQVHGAVGLRTLLSAQHSVQLTPESSASLVASWQPHVGLGLQFVSQRQLSSTINGEYSWVVGPPEAAGMSLGLTRRTEKTMLSGRLEVSSRCGAQATGSVRWLLIVLHVSGASKWGVLSSTPLPSGRLLCRQQR